MRKEETLNEHVRHNLRKELEQLKNKLLEETAEKEFFRARSLENKRQKKLLKIALLRVQGEYEQLFEQFKTVSKETQLQSSLTNKFEDVTIEIEDKRQSGDTFVTKPKDRKLNPESTLKLPTLISTLRVDDTSPRMFFSNKHTSIQTLNNT